MSTTQSNRRRGRRYRLRILFLIGAAGALAFLAEAGALADVLWPPPSVLSSTSPPLHTSWRVTFSESAFSDEAALTPLPAKDAWRARAPRMHVPPQPEVPPPHTWPAAEAVLPDDALVIGVEVGGSHRAYLLSVLGKGPAYHIVNDLIGGLPLSVSYCNIHDCVQVVTARGADPLKLQMDGLDGWSMLVAVGGHVYRQNTLEPLEADSPAFPYRQHSWERTTWGAWKSAHPDTDVYLGRDAAATPPGQTG